MDSKIKTPTDIKEFHWISEGNTEYPRELYRHYFFININCLLILSFILDVVMTLSAGIILLGLAIGFASIGLAVTFGAVIAIGFAVAVPLSIGLCILMGKIIDYLDLISEEKRNFCDTLNNIASTRIEQTPALNRPLVFFNSHLKTFPASRKSARNYVQTERTDEPLEENDSAIPVY